MSLEEIDQQYSAQIGKMSDSLEAAYDRIRANLDLSDAEREEAALEAHGKAVEAHWQATVGQVNGYAELSEDLTHKLFGASKVTGYGGEITREEFNSTQLAVIDLDDTQLATYAERAARTNNSTLAKVVAGEADARGMDDIAYAALKPWEDKTAAYTELKSIPSGEERARKIQNVREHGIPLPHMSNLRPTPEALDARRRSQAVEMMMRPRLPG
jgi:hypothetical protein